MRLFLLFLLAPLAGHALERVAVGNTSSDIRTFDSWRNAAIPICAPGQYVVAEERRLICRSFPECPTGQALTFRNGALACQAAGLEVVQVEGSALQWVPGRTMTYESIALCPAGYSVTGCSGGTMADGMRSTQDNESHVSEPITQGGRQGCRMMAEIEAAAYTRLTAYCAR